MAKFDITAAFQAAVGAAGNVSKLDTSRETIEYISLDKLEADPGNFYSLDGLEHLAANIELCGLQQPIGYGRRRTGGTSSSPDTGVGRRSSSCAAQRGAGTDGQISPALWSGTKYPRSSGSCG